MFLFCNSFSHVTSTEFRGQQLVALTLSGMLLWRLMWSVRLSRRLKARSQFSHVHLNGFRSG